MSLGPATLDEPSEDIVTDAEGRQFKLTQEVLEKLTKALLKLAKKVPLEMPADAPMQPFTSKYQNILGNQIFVQKLITQVIKTLSPASMPSSEMVAGDEARKMQKLNEAYEISCAYHVIQNVILSNCEINEMTGIFSNSQWFQLSATLRNTCTLYVSTSNSEIKILFQNRIPLLQRVFARYSEQFDATIEKSLLVKDLCDEDFNRTLMNWYAAHVKCALAFSETKLPQANQVFDLQYQKLTKIYELLCARGFDDKSFREAHAMLEAKASKESMRKKLQEALSQKVDFSLIATHCPRASAYASALLADLPDTDATHELIVENFDRLIKNLVGKSVRNAAEVELYFDEIKTAHFVYHYLLSLRAASLRANNDNFICMLIHTSTALLMHCQHYLLNPGSSDFRLKIAELKMAIDKDTPKINALLQEILAGKDEDLHSRMLQWYIANIKCRIGFAQYLWGEQNFFDFLICRGEIMEYFDLAGKCKITHKSQDYLLTISNTLRDCAAKLDALGELEFGTTKAKRMTRDEAFASQIPTVGKKIHFNNLHEEMSWPYASTRKSICEEAKKYLRVNLSRKRVRQGDIEELNVYHYISHYILQSTEFHYDLELFAIALFNQYAASYLIDQAMEINKCVTRLQGTATGVHDITWYRLHIEYYINCGRIFKKQAKPERMALCVKQASELLEKAESEFSRGFPVLREGIAELNAYDTEQEALDKLSAEVPGSFKPKNKKRKRKKPLVTPPMKRVAQIELSEQFAQLRLNDAPVYTPIFTTTTPPLTAKELFICEMENVVSLSECKPSGAILTQPVIDIKPIPTRYLLSDGKIIDVPLVPPPPEVCKLMTDVKREGYWIKTVGGRNAERLYEIIYGMLNKPLPFKPSQDPDNDLVTNCPVEILTGLGGNLRNNPILQGSLLRFNIQGVKMDVVSRPIVSILDDARSRDIKLAACYGDEKGHLYDPLRCLDDILNNNEYLELCRPECASDVISGDLKRIFRMIDYANKYGLQIHNAHLLLIQLHSGLISKIPYYALKTSVNKFLSHRGDSNPKTLLNMGILQYCFPGNIDKAIKDNLHAVVKGDGLYAYILKKFESMGSEGALDYDNLIALSLLPTLVTMSEIDCAALVDRIECPKGVEQYDFNAFRRSVGACLASIHSDYLSKSLPYVGFLRKKRRI